MIYWRRVSRRSHAPVQRTVSKYANNEDNATYTAGHCGDGVEAFDDDSVGDSSRAGEELPDRFFGGLLGGAMLRAQSISELVAVLLMAALVDSVDGLGLA